MLYALVLHIDLHVYRPKCLD